MMPERHEDDCTKTDDGQPDDICYYRCGQKRGISEAVKLLQIHCFERCPSWKREQYIRKRAGNGEPQPLGNFQVESILIRQHLQLYTATPRQNEFHEYHQRDRAYRHRGNDLKLLLMPCAIQNPNDDKTNKEDA